MKQSQRTKKLHFKDISCSQPRKISHHRIDDAFLSMSFQGKQRMISVLSHNPVQAIQAYNLQRTSASVVLHARTPKALLVFTGPPCQKEKDREHCQRFMQFSGQKIICGGTTSNIVARELGRNIETTMASGTLPGISMMEGVDLVTEGILTMSRVLEYLKNPPSHETRNAASRLVDLLKGNDSITFMVGMQKNLAYSDPKWPVELELRKTVVKGIARILEEEYQKKIEIEFI